MKRFLFKSLLLMLPLILASYPVDLIISKNLEGSIKYAGEVQLMSDIYDGEAECDIAIYGSSRAWVHIDPLILEDSLGLSSYNFGVDGHNFWLQYLRHLEFLKHNRKPKHIVYSVDVFSLKKRKDLYLMEQFMPFMLWNRNIRKYTSSYIGFSTLDYYLPLKRYIGQKKELKTGFALEEMSNITYTPRVKGFKGMNREWNDDLIIAMSKRKQFYSEMDPESITLYERFIQECDALLEGPSVCFLHLPTPAS